MKNSYIKFIFLFLFLQSSNCSKDNGFTGTEYFMDTYCTIKINNRANGKKTTEKSVEDSFLRIKSIEQKLNPLDKDSPVYKFNNSGTPITDTEIIKLVKIAVEISEKTDGFFDITIFPVVNLWGFYSERQKVPDKKSVEKALEKVNYKYLIIRSDRIEPGIKGLGIDFGGMAKGYAVEEAVKILTENHKINVSGLIDFGGDIYALGKKDLNTDWIIGIKNPAKDGVIRKIKVSNLSVVTSGDYHRYFIEGGKKYHHIFNPKTGFPAEGVHSMTIVTGNNLLADALSTAFFAMGKKKAHENLGNFSAVEILMIDSGNNISFSAGFPKYFSE